MIKNRFVLPLVSCIFLSTCVPCTVKSKDDNTGLVIAGVGAAVGLIGGLIWAFQPDDPETTLNKSQETYRSIKSKHEEATAILEQNSTEVRFLDETILLNVARAGIHHQCSYITSSVATVNDAIHTAEKATIKAKTDCLKNELRLIVDKLRKLKKRLVRLQECLTVHDSYFNLFDATKNIAAAHAREIEAYTHALNYTPDHGNYRLKESLNACLSLRYSSCDAEWKYPYLTYAKKTSSDIQDLERKISRASSYYHTLILESETLLVRLKNIYHLVVNTTEYHNNLHAYEQARLERERLELERARLHAEQERAAIERARLRAEREKVEIERARLYEERIRHYCTICAHEWYILADRCNCNCCR